MRATWLSDQVRTSMRRDSPFRRVVWTVLFTLMLAFIFLSGLAPERYDLSVGQLSPQEIRAPRTVVDRIETERMRLAAANAVDLVVEQDTKVVEEAVTEAKSVFAAIRQIRTLSETFPEGTPEEEGAGVEGPAAGEGPTLQDTQQEALAAIKALDELSAADRSSLLAVTVTDLSRLEQAVIAVVRQVMDSGIKEESLPAFRGQVVAAVEAMDLREPLKPLLAQIAQRLVRPNMVVNHELTQERKRRAMDDVEPARVLEGDIIIEEGERATDWHLAILRELGLERSQSSWRVPAGSLMLAMIVLVLIGLYVTHFERPVLEQESLIVLTGLILILTVTLIEVLKPISGFLPPVAAGTMLLAILVSPRLALFIGSLLSLIASVLNGFEIQYMICALVGGAVGVHGIVRIGQRSDMAKTGIFVAAANVIAVTLAALLMGSGSVHGLALWKDIGWAAANGMFAAVLTIGSLPFFENYFGLITPVKLLELANPNQPLMRRLLVETPGTYHHSVMVANLAEAGVEAIGGNSLLARVGAYYHDVGKLKRPYFFIENQMATDNPHEKISPTLSVLILTSHIRDGVELARAAKLPDAIIHFIREHHGTTLAGTFYSRAAENGRDDQVPEQDFRYEGPRPQTRETALVMLADSCEAAVRSLARATPARIDSMVRRIIRERLNDQQLDRCDLTLRELDVIADTFVRVLTGVFHPRIEYPDMIPEIEQREGDCVAAEDANGKGQTGQDPKGVDDSNQQSAGQGPGRWSPGSDDEKGDH